MSDITPIQFPDPSSVEMKVNITAGKVNELIEILNLKEAPEPDVIPDNCRHDNSYVMNIKIGLKKCKTCKKVWRE